MRRLAFALTLALAACSRDPRAASTGSGSASGAATAANVVVDAAAPDAPKLALHIARACEVAGLGVHCTITPKDGAVPAGRCWRASVAIEDHVAAKLRLVTSAPACTAAIASGVATPLDLTFGPKDKLDKACAADNACDVMLSAVDDLTKDQAPWRAQLQAQLADDKTEREQAARDREPADDGAFDKLYKHYAELSIEDEMNERWKEHPDRRDVERSIYAAGPMIMQGAIPPDIALTKGDVRCALAASSSSDFRDCFAAAADAARDAGIADADVADAGAMGE